MTKPRISVGMPVYNGERFLEAAIRSVLDQTYRDFELIISDNASTDRTEQICNDFAAQDRRIRYVRNERNLGASKNYNQAFAAANGEFFRWANADDLSHLDSHELCIKTLDENPDAVLCYGKTTLIDENGDVIEEYEDNLDLRQTRPSDRFIRFFQVVGLTNAIYGLMRTAALGTTGLMGDYMSSDVYMMAELTLHGKFIEIPRTLFYRRFHSSAFSQDRKQDQHESEAKQKEFWNPELKGFALQTWKKHRGTLKAIARSPAHAREKLRARAYVMRMMYWQRAELLGELGDAVRRKISRA